ncbi:YihY/virulence factor BrkB family protein [Polynucleobacter necessarius]|uniref:YihY/virulence factor BrkB family protein n=1 Tax=Polynucleobacter necessarius TaxID=576610 RepID=UPI0018D4FDDC|nr:YhjD/YihY/BrkB family envelope integrity protein [Polynucleobacter necessarius]
MPGGVNQQVFIYLDQFSYQARGLAYVGLAGLIITTIMTLAVIEGAFNQIFKVTQSRPLYKKIAIYGAATVLVPILLGFWIYLSGVLFSASEGWISAISVGFQLVATIAPVCLAILVYAVVYKILPYAKILWRDAFTGAFVAALAFELMKFGFAIFF